jgi:hypothetical protein
MFGSFLNFLPYTEVDMERVLLSHARESTLSKGDVPALFVKSSNTPQALRNERL